MFKRHSREIVKKVAMGASNTGHQQAKEKNQREGTVVEWHPCTQQPAKEIFTFSFSSII